ncbi:MAG: hypothetical protein ACTSQZ_07200 [Candidatus Thorarchaeota archaeon]
MIILDLGTFGAVMKFAMELESIAAEFYKFASSKASDADLVNLLEKLVNRSTKRNKILERVRRENVTEMILEPITGLDSDSYNLKTNIPENPDDKSLLGICIGTEEKRFKFFSEGSAKIGFLIEAADTFERLADENQDNVETLKKMF